MGQRLRLRIGWLAINLTVLSLAAVSIVSVIGPWPDILPIPRFASQSTAIVLLFVWVGVWLLVGALFTRLRWRLIGRAAGLTPEGGGLTTSPDLTGRIAGRQVRAVRGNEVETVLTELSSDPTAGAIVGHLDETYSRLEFAEHADHTDGDLAALASDPELAETLLTGRSGEALASSDHSPVVFAGNVPNAVHTWDPDSDVITYEGGDEQKIRHDSPTWDVFADRSEDKPGGTLLTNELTTGGRQTVACVKFSSSDGINTSNPAIKDGQELRERADAAVAVADAFEDDRSVSGDVDET